MKFTTKLLIKLNPSFLNNVDESELTDEIIIYALENGYDYNKDINDKFCMYDTYINWNLKNKTDFINSLIYSKHFNYDKISLDNKSIVQGLIKNNPSLIQKLIEKDIRFIEFLSKDLINDLDYNSLVWSLNFNNISYSQLNEEFLIDNYKLGLEYLNVDFSNIVNFMKYNSNYKFYEKEIIEIFNKNIKNSINYLSELNVFELDDKTKENIVELLKNEGILINSNTPKFIFNNKYIISNLIKYDLNNSKYIDREIYLSNEDNEYIINNINEDKIVFDEIPLCFKKNKEIVFTILKNNIDLIDSKNFDYNLYLDIIFDLVKTGDYKLNSFTNIGILEYLASNHLKDILELDFSNIKYFEDLNIVCLYNFKNIYNILKNNNYKFDRLNKIFSSNPYIIKECLENNIIKFEDIDFSKISFNDSTNEEKVNFQIYIINTALEKSIENNEIINRWKSEVLDLNREHKFNTSNIYVEKIKNDSLVSYPSNVSEIFSSEADIDSINLLIDRVKSSNNNIERIVVDLPEELYNLEELERIKDKELVVFGSKNDITRITVEDMIKTEKTLDLFVSDIKSSSLSPYEKYLAVYNIVKSFKDYRFYKDNKDEDHDYADQSRNVYLIMQNDYIVCVGYARLLQTLLKRVGINSVAWSVQTINDSHQRNYVNIVDSKYDINGYYMCDATWDKVQDEMMLKRYDHVHLTTNDARQENEFDKSIDPNADLYDEMFNDYTDEEMLNYLKEGYHIHNNFHKLKEIMKKLDPILYEKIKDRKLSLELASEINVYFKTKLNKNISKEVDLKAILEINQYIEGRRYSEEEYIEKWNDAIVLNGYSINPLNGFKYDMLIGNLEDDINKYIEYLKTVKLIDCYDIIDLNNNKLGNYKKMCVRQAFYKLSSQFLVQENDMSFQVGYDNSTNKLFMSISINIELMEKVKEKLEEMGYIVELNPGYPINIVLDNKYLDKSLFEAYSDFENIKNDCLLAYNEVLSTKLK